MCARGRRLWRGAVPGRRSTPCGGSSGRRATCGRLAAYSPSPNGRTPSRRSCPNRRDRRRAPGARCGSARTRCGRDGNAGPCGRRCAGRAGCGRLGSGRGRRLSRRCGSGGSRRCRRAWRGRGSARRARSGRPPEPGRKGSCRATRTLPRGRSARLLSGGKSVPEPRVTGCPGDANVHEHEEVHDDRERLVEDVPVVEELPHPLPE